MEITIRINGRDVTAEVSVEVRECLNKGKHKAENLAHEQRRHWDDRGYDKYIAATEGHLPYSASPEELVCQQETLDEIMAVLALCTEAQRERFLLHALISLMRKSPGFVDALKLRSITASKPSAKNLPNFFAIPLNNWPFKTAIR